MCERTIYMVNVEYWDYSIEDIHSRCKEWIDPFLGAYIDRTEAVRACRKLASAMYAKFCDEFGVESCTVDDTGFDTKGGKERYRFTVQEVILHG